MRETLLSHTALLIPVYNEEAHIVSIWDQCKRLGVAEIIMVNDGSTDNTGALLDSLPCTAIHHPINRGQGAAIATGLSYLRESSGWQHVLMVDGDGQFKIRDAMRIIEPLMEGKADLVLGNRKATKEQMPIKRRVYNNIANIVTYLLSGYAVPDSQTGCRALSRYAVERLHLESNRYEFCTEMLRKASEHKLRIASVPVYVSYSTRSMAKGQNFATGLHTVGKLIIESLMR